MNIQRLKAVAGAEDAEGIVHEYPDAFNPFRSVSPASTRA
jgi:hypothetical protein